MLDVSIRNCSLCRLKSPLALSGKNFLSTKVARGARRVNNEMTHTVNNYLIGFFISESFEDRLQYHISKRTKLKDSAT